MTITPNYGKSLRFTPQRSFKNNQIKTGSFQITGSIVAGANTRTFTIPLNNPPDMLQVVFNTAATSSFYTIPYPTTAWWKQGDVADDAGGLGTAWTLAWTISGSSVIVTAIAVNQTTTTYTSNGPTVNYRIVDYSIF